MKRINGAVEFEWDHARFRLMEDGLWFYSNVEQDWIPYPALEDMLRTETVRALLAEAIEALDHPYRGINVNVPPHMRSTPRGNK